MPSRYAPFLPPTDVAGRDPSEPEMKIQVAGYIEALSGEMLAMARAAKLDALVYFLDAARREAAIQAKTTGNSDS